MTILNDRNFSGWCFHFICFFICILSLSSSLNNFSFICRERVVCCIMMNRNSHSFVKQYYLFKCRWKYQSYKPTQIAKKEKNFTHTTQNKRKNNLCYIPKVLIEPSNVWNYKITFGNERSINSFVKNYCCYYYIKCLEYGYNISHVSKELLRFNEPTILI